MPILEALASGLLTGTAGTLLVQRVRAALYPEVDPTRRSPSEVLAELQRGNARFWAGHARRPEKVALTSEGRAIIAKQRPLAAVMGCSDSRVPVEIVFDQNLGELFVVRVAGNTVSPVTHASLQFAVNRLKVKVIVVMGHECCSAVQAAQAPKGDLSKIAPQLVEHVRELQQNFNSLALARMRDAAARDREAVASNVMAQVEALLADKCIMERVRRKELILVGALFQISSGVVDFFHEVSELGGRSAPSAGVRTRCTTHRRSETVLQRRHD